MVFLRDEGSLFDAPLDTVWQFVSSGPKHSEAHRHRATERRTLSGNSGEYTWEQDFGGKSERFTMRWTTSYPVGIAYEVLEGPFAGSRFFLYYVPRGRQTEVVVVGEFVSPTLPESEVGAAVDRFLSTEFEQDRAAIEALAHGS